MSTETVRKCYDDFNPRGMIAEFGRHPGETATVRLPGMTAGLLVRRQVRAALNDARVRGAEVEVHEEKGWLDSVFSVRMRGTDRQLLPALWVLAALAEDA
jgi:hypothetical protein